MTAPVSTHLGNDPELVTAAQEGDEGAFVTLYERHAPIAWRTALALTGDPDDARAVVSESFARTFTAIRTGRVDPGTTLRTVLLTSVRNATLDRRRELDDAATSVPQFEYAGEDARMIALAFGPLPERWRTALWLTEVEGLRAKQIAPVVGLASPATMNLIGRAHSGLSEQYLQLHLGQVNNRTCSRSVSRLASYVSGTLSPSDTAKVERHLGLCDACAARQAKVRDVGHSLRALIVPLPNELVDEARTAWAAAVATPVGRTGTGLSPTVEKVLAGVSAVAAAVGVFGAAMLGSNDGGDDERAAAAAPVAAESSEPVDSDPLAGVTPIDLPSPGTSGGNDTVGGSFGTAARQGTTTNPIADDGVIGASQPGGNRTPADDLHEPTEPGTAEAAPEDDDTAVPSKSEPVVKVETTVGDVPVSVEVGEDPGITVGDATVGSSGESEATTESDDSIVSVGGALEPLAPVVEPVDEIVSGITKTLGL